MQSVYYKDTQSADSALNFIKFEPTTENSKFIDRAWCIIANDYKEMFTITAIDSEIKDTPEQNSLIYSVIYNLNKSEATQLRDYLNKFLEE